MTTAAPPAAGPSNAKGAETAAPPSKRVSYILPPPQQPARLLHLPSVAENFSSMRGRSGPFVRSLNSSSPADTSHLSSNAGGSANQHPRHSLPVSSLAIDASTVVQGCQDGTPSGILYTGGRDGMIGAWELGLRMKRKSLATGYDNDLDEEDEIEEGIRMTSGSMEGVSRLNGGRDSEYTWGVDESDGLSRKEAQFRQCLGSHTDWINDIALCNQNQTVISASSDRTVKIWNPHDPKTSLIPQTLGTHKDYVRALALATGPNWIASGSFDQTIKIWDLKEMRADPIMTITEPILRHSIYALAVDIRGSVVAAATPEKMIQLFDPRSGQQISQLIGHTDNVRSVVMSSDGSHLLSASSDSTIRLWSLAEQRCLHTFTHHNDSVWSLYSNHDSLDIFYSGDRSGVVCKVDWERCNEVSEGECVVLAKEMCRPSEAKFNRGSPQDDKAAGIYKIVAVDNAYFWTAGANSSVSRWKDIPPRSEREARYPIASRSYSNPAEVAAKQARRELSPLAPAGVSSSSSYRPSALRGQIGPNVITPPSVSFAEHLSTSSPRAVDVKEQEEAGTGGKDDELRSAPTLYGVPFESLICLALPNDPYGEAIGLGSISVRAGGQERKGNTAGQTNTVFSSASLISIPSVLRAAASSRRDSHALASPNHEGTGSPSRTGGATAPWNAYLANAHLQHSEGKRPSSTRSASLRFAPVQSRYAHSIEEGPGSYEEGGEEAGGELEAEESTDLADEAEVEARQAFEERDSAIDAVPLRKAPEDAIDGSHGLIRSTMLNDRRHVLTIDSAGMTYLWDIATSQCLGSYTWEQVRQAWVDSGGSGCPKETFLLPGDALDLIKERIQGEGATSMWCNIDTKIGALSVHLEDSRCFEAEIYVDELDPAPLDSQGKEDQRISIAKLVLRNLFDGFIREEARLRSRGKAGEKVRLTGDVLAMERSPEFLQGAKKPNLKLGLDRLGSSREDASTPGMTIALAVPAKSPAVLQIASPLTPRIREDIPGLQQLLESERISGSSAVGSESTGGAGGLGDYFSLQSNSQSNSRVQTPLAKSPALSPSSPGGSGLMGRLRMSIKRSDTAKKDDKLGSPSRNNSGASGAGHALNNGRDEEQNVQTSATTAETKLQLERVRQIMAKADPAQVLDEIPYFPFPPHTAITISESLSTSQIASSHANYRGLVKCTDRDVATLELATPSWLLEYLVGLTLATPATKEKDKLTFVLLPWESPAEKDRALSEARQEKMPVMPTGNSRLTATKMLRIRKACTYVVEKLGILDADNVEARSRANSIIVSRRNSENNVFLQQHHSNDSSTTNSSFTASLSSSPPSSSGAGAPLSTDGRPHNPFLKMTSMSTASADSIGPSPNKALAGSHKAGGEWIDLKSVRADEIVEILCNGTVLAPHCTLAQVQRFYWKSSNVVKLEYRWREP